MENENTHLIQFKLSNNSLLILTSEEFKKALKRGNSVVHNRNLRDKKLDADVLEIEELSHG